MHNLLIKIKITTIYMVSTTGSFDSDCQLLALEWQLLVYVQKVY